jgi:Zn-dependent protease
MKPGWQVGSIFGIPLLIDSSWFIILALFTFSNATRFSAENLSTTTAWVAGLALSLSLFGSVLLHELGHSLAALSQGIKVNSITLFLFGGIAAIDRESKTPGIENTRTGVSGGDRRTCRELRSVCPVSNL